MSGKSSDNSQMIARQDAEAAEARKKEAERKARIASGLAKIKAAFHGTEGKKTVQGKATKLAEGSLPAGYKIVMQGATQPTTRRVQVQNPNQNSIANTYRTEVVPGKPGTKMVQGPDGKLYALGTTVTPSSVVGTGKFTGGTGDFLKDYEQGYLGNYLPQVAQKFKEAKDETTYALARAGTLNSQAAADELAKLIEQNKINEADVRTKATEAVGDLKDRLAKEEASATAQLYSTENPEVAASNAVNAVQNITAEEPSTTPLGAIFDVAAIGGANYLKGANNAYLKNKYVPGNQKATTIVG